ncbi:NAD-dependent epimerase [Podospora appendiculata]|uniref:NAD-dependent epimerase n=1 Tax=Podospora appendiculata TaxID=314037 RepID=A0AAE1C7E2_9PEZI|nr:NAD-dependent epimerase [Podospora appendiculata]
MSNITPTTYAVLGSTGNCGTALIEILLQKPNARINAYCRNRSKLHRLLPTAADDKRIAIFEGNIADTALLASCIRGCLAVFLCVSTNDNIPGCRLAQDTASAVIHALQSTPSTNTLAPPKLILLSSGTIDANFSRHVPFLLQPILLRSASHVYRDLLEAERLLRAQEPWLTTVYVKPGALSVDVRRGHALSLTDQDSPVSYLDLAAAMVDVADDAEGRWDGKNVSVVNTHGAANEIQAATLEKFIKGWAGWTPDGFLSTWSSTCTQTTLPFSSDVPPRTRSHVEHLFPILMSVLSNFEMTVHNVVHDTAHGKAVIYALTKADTPWGPYKNEHALFLWFDESGTEVDRIEEMFDALVMKEFLPKIQEHVARQKAEAEAKAQAV